MKKTLCQHCDNGCQDYEYLRFDRNGNLQSFQYCQAGADTVKITEWYIQKDGYAYSTTRINGQKTFYHTLFKKDKNKVIDHVNGDRTDNRFRNLREVSASENSQNIHVLWKDKRMTSKFPGVYYNRKEDCWMCQARKHKINHPDTKHFKKGGFKTEYEAFECYINILKEWGREVNTETDVYKDYLKWKGEVRDQVTLEAFV